MATTTELPSCSQLSYSLSVPASNYVAKSLRGNTGMGICNHTLQPQTMKQYFDKDEDETSSSSYVTSVDHGKIKLKGGGHGHRSGSVFDKKQSHKTELQERELGSVKKLGKIEEPLEEAISSSLVLDELPNEDSGTCIDFALGPCNEFYLQQDEPLMPCPSVGNYQSADDSLCNGTEYVEAKDSFGTITVGDCTSSVNKSGGSAKVSDSGDFAESRKTSTCRDSTGTDVSDESNLSILTNAVNKPHQANDARWEAIQAVRSRDGTLGINQFKLLRRLGCGDIGSVYLSELSGTKAYYAMKVMDKAALTSRKKLPRAQTEREILQCLDHPFLPTLYTHFETEKFSCLVMEFCPGGDLHALRQKQPNKHFPEHAARFYVAEVLLALEYLHMLGIIYRDLKPENVLVRDDGHIMLSDFDLSLRCAVSPTLVKSSNTDVELSNNSSYCVQPACVSQPSCMRPSCFRPRFSSSKSKKEKKNKPRNEMNNDVRTLPELIAEPTGARSMSFVGTHEYLAPEIIKGEGHGSAVDWWTFGIFLYELLYGKTPFKGSANRATLFNVVGQPLRFPESPTVSFAARDLIRGLLVKEPQHRLAYRRGATEIKRHPFFQNINWALIRCTNPPEVPKPFIKKISATREISTAPKTETGLRVDVKPSGNYLEIDFF